MTTVARYPMVGGTYVVDPHGETYTVYVRYRFGTGTKDYTVEEIDVRARSRAQARRAASVILEQDYAPGGRIADVSMPRAGLYL